MRKYALLQNNVVVEIRQLEEYEVQTLGHNYSIVIDIEDELPQPEVGWVLEGNKLISLGSTETQEQFEIELASKKTSFGILLAREAIDKIGARNKILNKTGSQVTTLLNQLVGIKLLLETGALGTARYSCTQLKSIYTEYTDIFDIVISAINNFEQKYGL